MRLGSPKRALDSPKRALDRWSEKPSEKQAEATSVADDSTVCMHEVR